MKRRADLFADKKATREAVGQITCWCIAIALHQRFGVGRDRLERVAAGMGKVQDEIAAVIDELGHAKGMRMLADKLGGVCETEFRVPLNRAVKNRRERELRIDGDIAATAAWDCFAVAIRDVLGFGTERLNRVREEALANYRQFNGWYCEDPQWAMTRLQHCAEQAMREKIDIVQQEDPEPDNGPGLMLEYQRAAERNLQDAVLAESQKKNLRGKAVNVLSDEARRTAAMQVDAMLKEDALQHRPGTRLTAR